MSSHIPEWLKLPPPPLWLKALVWTFALALPGICTAALYAGHWRDVLIRSAGPGAPAGQADIVMGLLAFCFYFSGVALGIYAHRYFARIRAVLAIHTYPKNQPP
jgi:hypothetical protein